MPIQFACPACKNTMTVDSKFAGKSGKCNKCGGAVTVPNTAPAAGAAQGASGKATVASSASTAIPTKAEAKAAQIAALNAAPPPSAGKLSAAGPLGHVLDELTESDYSRQSPYQNVYAPPKPKANNNAMLNKAASTAGGADDNKAKVGADGKAPLTWTLIIYGVLDVLEGVILYAAAIGLAILGVATIDEFKDKIPFLGAGLAVFIMILGLQATLFMAAGLGIFTEQVWGYCVALFVYSFNLGIRLVSTLANITNTEVLPGQAISLLIMLGFTSYFLQKDCKAVFGISKGSKLPLIAGGAGLGLSLVIGGVLFLLGAFVAIAVGPE